MKCFFEFLCILALALPTSAFAYGGGDGGYGTRTAALSDATTNKVVRTLTRGVKACQRLERVYRYDCYRNTYAVAANQLNNIKDYEAARKILLQVENSLAKTIARNEDKAAPRKRRGVEQFRAIREQSLPRAKRDFVTALDRAETQLLRSSGNSGDHFIRIAQAINTNKVLIRSSLLLSPFSPFSTAVLAVQVLARHEWKAPAI
jgi:hypothetical protein